MQPQLLGLPASNPITTEATPIRLAFPAMV